MKEKLLLARLLDKYEKSKHLMRPGASARRVMLRVEKKEFPEYTYEDAQVRDDWNRVVKDLEAQHLVPAQWLSGRPVLSCVILNLEHVPECYKIADRSHPKERAQSVENMVASYLSCITTDWIAEWREEVCRQAKEGYHTMRMG